LVNEKYPDAFFFDGLEATYLAASRDLTGGLQKLETVQTAVANLPAFLFLVNVRMATFLVCKFEWAKAAEHFTAAVRVYQGVGRRAFCPTLSMNAHICYLAAGEPDKAAEALEVARGYKSEKKKWSALDKVSLRQAELAAAAAGDEQVEVP